MAMIVILKNHNSHFMSVYRKYRLIWSWLTIRVNWVRLFRLFGDSRIFINVFILKKIYNHEFNTFVQIKFCTKF